MPMVPCRRQGWEVERYTRLESDEDPLGVARGDPPGLGYLGSLIPVVHRVDF